MAKSEETLTKITQTERKRKEYRWHTIEEVEQALIDGKGYYSQAAKILGVSTTAVLYRVRRSPRLQKVRAGVDLEVVEWADASMIGLARQGDYRALSRILNTKGKEFGYAETQIVEGKHEHSGPDGAPIPLGVPLEKLIKTPEGLDLVEKFYELMKGDEKE